MYVRIVGMEGNVITLQEIFVYERQGIDEQGKVLGQFKATGVRPRICEKLKSAGLEVNEEMFDPDKDHN